MAKKANGEYYYDAGTINEQLDDYEVYEQDGRLYLNREATGDEAVAFDGLGLAFPEWRTTQPGTDEVAEDETLVYVYNTGTDVIVQAAHNNDSSMLYADLGTFATAGE